MPLFGVSVFAVHPPADSTALSFTYGAGAGRYLELFPLCVGLNAALVGLQRAMCGFWRAPVYQARNGYMKLYNASFWAEMGVRSAVQWLRLGVETLGALIVGLGVLLAATLFMRALATRQTADFNAIRLTLARYLALALEFQLGADILSTAVAPSWQEIGKLGAIAVIRTALNLFLSREMRDEQQGLRAKAEAAVQTRAQSGLPPAGGIGL